MREELESRVIKWGIHCICSLCAYNMVSQSHTQKWNVLFMLTFNLGQETEQFHCHKFILLLVSSWRLLNWILHPNFLTLPWFSYCLQVQVILLWDSSNPDNLSTSHRRKTTCSYSYTFIRKIFLNLPLVSINKHAASWYFYGFWYQK
jgi:hypothetical protein